MDGESMSYNGYASQDEFHQALAARSADWIADRERQLRDNPEGLRHEGCDHAYGICSEGGWK